MKTSHESKEIIDTDKIPVQIVEKSYVPNKKKRKFSRITFDDGSFINFEHRLDKKENPYPKGSFALIKKCQYLDQTVAVKIIPRGEDRSWASDMHNNLEKRKRIIHRVKHEFAANQALGRKVLLCERKDSHKLYLVMPYIHGTELFYFMQNNKNIPLSQILFIMINILRQVTTLHQNNWIIIDISFDNVMISNNGASAELIDLGSCIQCTSPIKNSGELPFKTAFFNPENFDNFVKGKFTTHSPHTDRQSLAILLIMMLRELYQNYEQLGVTWNQRHVKIPINGGVAQVQHNFLTFNKHGASKQGLIHQPLHDIIHELYHSPCQSYKKSQEVLESLQQLHKKVVAYELKQSQKILTPLWQRRLGKSEKQADNEVSVIAQAVKRRASYVATRKSHQHEHALNKIQSLSCKRRKVMRFKKT